MFLYKLFYETMATCDECSGIVDRFFNDSVLLLHQTCFKSMADRAFSSNDPILWKSLELGEAQMFWIFFFIFC